MRIPAVFLGTAAKTIHLKSTCVALEIELAHSRARLQNSSSEGLDTKVPY